MALKFVDVASHQGNYTVGSNGEDGVIIKATQGTNYTNPNLDHVAQQAIKKNIPWAFYHYAGGGDPVAEADFYIKTVQPYLNTANKPQHILDWEKYQNAAYGNGKWAETYLNRVKEKLGVQAGIYGNSTDMSQMPAAVYTTAWLWFAGYPYMPGTKQPYTNWQPCNFPYSLGNFKTLTGWQFTSTPLDKSLFYVTREQWDKLGGGTIDKPNNTNNTKKVIEEDDMKVIKIDGKDTLYLVRTTGVTSMTADEWVGVKRVYGFKDTDVDVVNQAEFDGIKTALAK
jgi:lysozyme